MKKRWMILLFCVFFLTALIGYTVKFLRENDKPKVVVVLKELDSQYWKIVKGGVEKGFRDFDIDGKIFATHDGFVEEQNDILKNILKEKPDVVIVAPISASNIPILKEFDKNNIPVLLVDTNDLWENKTSYIGTDNFELGRKAGELLASQLQPGDEVALPLFDGFLTNQVFSERINGVKYSLEDAGVTVLVDTIKLRDELSSVKKAMTNILQDHPDVKGVFAVNDIIALSVFEVTKEHGYKIPIVGADGVIEMVDLIEDGTLTSTIAQNPYDMGYISVETAVKVIKGEKVAKNIDTGIDIITKDNAKQKLDFLKQLLK